MVDKNPNKIDCRDIEELLRLIPPEAGSLKLKLRNKELVRNCEAEIIKEIRNFRLKANHMVPYKKTYIRFYALTFLGKTL